MTTTRKNTATNSRFGNRLAVRKAINSKSVIGLSSGSLFSFYAWDNNSSFIGLYE